MAVYEIKPDGIRRQAKIDAAFGSPLRWERSDKTVKSEITCDLPGGGYRSDRAEWPASQDRMIAAMVRLEKTFSPFIDELRNGDRS